MLIWEKEWNGIVRYVFFKDDELKKLMKVPSNTTIIPFVDKYFIRAGYTNEILENEPTRIVYSIVSGKQTETPNVLKYLIQFDIYVKREIQRTATPDRLMLRTVLIANRISQLLRRHRYVGLSGYRFWPAGEVDMGTRTVGYDRHMISFYFMRVD